MENIEANRKAVQLVEQWNPFQLTNFTYDVEAADVVAALQSIQQVPELAKRIQNIFELSFEEVIALERCEALAKQLIAIKTQVTTCER